MRKSTADLVAALPPYLRKGPLILSKRVQHKINKYRFQRVGSDTQSVSTDVQNWRMVLPTDDLEVSRQLFYNGVYDEPLVNVLREIIDGGQTIADVGSHIGFMTLVMAERVGSPGSVFALEPHPDNFHYLEENVRLNGYQDRVECLNFGLSDEESTSELHIHPENKGAHSIVHPSPTRNESSVEIQTKLGDTVLPRDVDFLKIDTEGAEPLIFKGLTETIKTSQPTIAFEYDSRLWDLPPRQALESLVGVGYSFERIGYFQDGYRQRITIPEILNRSRANLLAIPPK